MKSIKLAFFQYAVFHHSPEENFEYIRQAAEHKRCDLLTLPELFSCGYAFQDKKQLAGFAEQLEQSRTVQFLQQIARNIGGSVSGTIPELGRNGEIYNTAVLVDKNGLIGTQRKIHLPNYEKQFFSPGDDINVFSVTDSGIKTGMMTCFDSWFPEVALIMRRKKAGIILNSACFGGNVTPQILPVRARENQTFVVSCNRVGSEWFGEEEEHFCGMSQIISPDGRIITSADNREWWGEADVDLDEKPAFSSLICRDFEAEHQKYKVTLNREDG